ncbi:chloride channel protein [Nocardia terpenica]|nr:chloride channel protein [Nocardia terpenica]MBF6116381.1 chloride channel protein [Nocardia terpenica]MBF6123538.1 chloride channel protein [Nocardia terpenica]MBF6156815.1 chloride channel protein [Nocardia terpenica]
MTTSRQRASLVTVVHSALAGSVAALAATAFRRLVGWCTVLSTGAVTTERADGLPGGHWLLLALPVVGGAIYGPLTFLVTGRAEGHGVRVSLVNAVAAVLCIGSGGSAGRTGPVVQLGAAAAGGLAHLLRGGSARRRLLIAAGAAGGQLQRSGSGGVLRARDCAADRIGRRRRRHPARRPGGRRSVPATHR